MGVANTKLTAEQIGEVQRRCKCFLSSVEVEEWYKIFQTSYPGGSLTREKFITTFEQHPNKTREFWGLVFDSIFKTDYAIIKHKPDGIGSTSNSSQQANATNHSTASANSNTIQGKTNSSPNVFDGPASSLSFAQLVNSCSLHMKGMDHEKLEFGFHFFGGKTLIQDVENSYIDRDDMLKSLKSIYQVIGEKYIKELPQHLQTPESAVNLIFSKIKTQSQSPLYTIQHKDKSKVASKKQFIQQCIDNLKASNQGIPDASLLDVSNPTDLNQNMKNDNDHIRIVK